MRPKQIWITGAAGFLGHHTMDAFSRAGWLVSGIDLRPAGTHEITEDRWVTGDVTVEVLDRLLENGTPDCIFHAAGNGSVGVSFENPDLDYQGAVTATSIILDFIKTKVPSATFVFPSSAGVYGACPDEPLAEDRLLAPLSPYGKHKRIAEDLCKEASAAYGIRTIAIRFFSLYGAGLRKQLLWDLSQKAMVARDNVELFGTGHETRDMLDARDAAQFIFKLVELAGPGSTIVNGGTGNALSVAQIASLLLTGLAPDLEVRFTGENRLGDPRHYQADMKQASALGLAPQIEFEAGIRDYTEWFKTIYQNN